MPGRYKGTGIDLSRKSVDYARTQAEKEQLDVDYICTDFFDIEYEGPLMLCFRSMGKSARFLMKKGTCSFILSIGYKDNGIFIFDVSTRALRMREGLKNRWYVSEGGFWRPGRHLVLEEGFDYQENDTWLNQYIVVEENETVKVYRLWLHDFSIQ